MIGKTYKKQITGPIRGEGGFTLVEVIVAIVMFAVMVIYLGQIYANSTSYVVKQGDRRKATFLAQEKLEEISAMDFSTVEAMSDTTENDAGGYGGFTRTTSFDYVDDNDFSSVLTGTVTNAVRVTVVVGSSQGEQGFQDLTLQNVITDWR